MTPRPSQSSPRIVAVTLNWNQSKLTLECVGALQCQIGASCHVVVIDNGSRPDEWKLLSEGLQDRSGVEVVRLPKNRGFAGGMNVGIARAAELGATHVWLMNNDAFPEEGCLAKLVAVMDQDSKLAGVTSRLVGTDGVEQHAGGRFNPLTGESACFFADDFPSDGNKDGIWLIGTAPLMRVDAIQAVKGFDHSFFAYMEEIDLCLRIARQGWQFAVVPEVTTLHMGHASSGGNFPPFALYLHTRNQFKLCRKHLPHGRGMKFVVRYLRGCLDHAGCFVMNGRPERGRTIVEAGLAILTGESGAPRIYGASGKFGMALAKRPWKIVRIMDWLDRRISSPSRS